MWFLYFGNEAFSGVLGELQVKIRQIEQGMAEARRNRTDPASGATRELGQIFRLLAYANRRFPSQQLSVTMAVFLCHWRIVSTLIALTPEPRRRMADLSEEIHYPHQLPEYDARRMYDGVEMNQIPPYHQKAVASQRKVDKEEGVRSQAARDPPATESSAAMDTAQPMVVEDPTVQPGQLEAESSAANMAQLTATVDPAGQLEPALQAENSGVSEELTSDGEGPMEVVASSGTDTVEDQASVYAEINQPGQVLGSPVVLGEDSDALEYSDALESAARDEQVDQPLSPLNAEDAAALLDSEESK